MTTNAMTTLLLPHLGPQGHQNNLYPTFPPPPHHCHQNKPNYPERKTYLGMDIINRLIL